MECKVESAHVLKYIEANPNLKQAEVARHFHISRQRVHQIVKRHRATLSVVQEFPKTETLKERVLRFFRG